MGAPGTGYVGGSTGVSWLENAAQNAASDDDPGFMDGGPYVYSAGTSVVHRWFEPPLGAGIPTPTPATTFDFCYGCQSATAITVAAGALDGLDAGSHRRAVRQPERAAGGSLHA